EDRYDDVFIVLDKMDKIGADGVREELLGSGYDESSVEKCMSIFDDASSDDGESDGSAEAETGKACLVGMDRLKKIVDTIGADLEDGVAANLIDIIEVAAGASATEFKIKFDPTLVRGMSYYTGPIFEIAMDEYGGSVGGGGRYDTMVGRFLGTETPAVGFSIGFERISMLLMERGYSLPDVPEKKAFLIDKKCSDEQIREVITKANDLRRSGVIVTVDRMKKNKKFQKDQLTLQGFSAIEEIFAD
ncbi:MAG: ATP phosphoribosyltransferase regulatory subunit, partial [Eubacterium sp.]|nr:ATP phosphoribosyltransferase regulatory subunit [Eubacterium sp.]